MTGIIELYRSAVVKKFVMALTGLMLFGFVLGHMAGNMKLYLGQYETGEHQGIYKIDVYAEALREIGTPFLRHGDFLWIARFGLLAAVGLHILSAWQLTLINRRARPVGYQQQSAIASTYASRTMRWGGVILLLFVIYHLLHLTTGHVHHEFQPGEVYHNVVAGFSVPWVSGIYILAQLALGLHLYHGLWSLFQSLGLAGPRFNIFRHRFAIAFAILITAGNLSFPVAVLTGLIAN
jgi:succinate dehydrogenase / fumarate reductase cytochrome b subunit